VANAWAPRARHAPRPLQRAARGDDGGGQATLCRPIRPECRARNAHDLALHVVVNEIIAANRADIPQGPRAEAGNAGPSHHFLVAVLRKDLVHHQRQTDSRAALPPKLASSSLKVLLVHQADRRIVHADRTTRQSSASPNGKASRNFFSGRRGQRFRRKQTKRLLMVGLGVAEEGRAAVAIGLAEVGSGAARHQKILQFFLPRRGLTFCAGTPSSSIE